MEVAGQGTKLKVGMEFAGADKGDESKIWELFSCGVLGDDEGKGCLDEDTCLRGTEEGHLR